MAITGGALAETITGGANNDLLTGGADTYVFATAEASANGNDSLVFGVVNGNTVDDILNFTACDTFIGTTTEIKEIFADANVQVAVTGAAAGQNILFLTN
jgi:hypothetical protein